MTTQPHGTDDLYDDLYDRYARPLEAEHWGEFIIIAPDGRYVIGETMVEVLERAVATIGPGHRGYRIGTRYVGTTSAPYTVE